MEFNLGRKNECVECVLEPLSGDGSVEIDYIQFRKSSVSQIADIMERGVRRENQDLVVDCVMCKKDEFKKISGKRYKAKFVGIADIGNHTVTAIEFVLANIEIEYDMRNIRCDSDDVYIDFAKITVYPHGTNYFKEIED